MGSASPRARYQASPVPLDQELARAAEDGARRIVFHLQEGDVELTPQELDGIARRGASFLAGLGVAPGDTVGVLGPNRPEWVRWAFSAWAAGAALVPLGFPLRVRDAESVTTHVGRLIDAAGCRAVLADPSFAELFPGDRRVVPWDAELPEPVATGPAPGRVSVDDPAIIQFTSGSTAHPKGVVLTHREVLGQAWGLDAYYGTDRERDRFISWLPLFHDNGLFLHLLTPLVLQCENHIIPTKRFAGNPGIWFRLATETGATITSGPPSAWSVAMRAAARRPAGLDLSALQIGVLTAEMIQPEVVDHLNEVGSTIGLDRGALAAGYGMAEATLAVTISPRGTGIAFDPVDAEKLASGEAVPDDGPGAKRVVSCGPPMPGLEVRIWDGGREAAERTVGEVQLRGVSIMRGYLGLPDDEQPFLDGWLRTGDLGYVAGGELHVTGRTKDVVIVGGRNYAPEDIEWVVGQVPGVRAGRCIAFAPPGVDGEILLALEATNEADPGILPEHVKQAVMNAIGVPVRDVLIVAKGSTPFTTSGKLQRSATRAAYADGTLELEGTLGA